MKKIWQNIKKWLYAVPFGMKAGDELLATSNTGGDEVSSIHQQVEHKSVLQDLLNGKVTQEVEELRYETFKAEEMSNEYKYIGNGVALKKKGDEATVRNKRRKFVQYNLDEEYCLQESLAMLENENNNLKDDWATRKIFKATYNNPNVRFKLENAVHMVRVELNDDTYKTWFYFVDDKLNRNIRPLVNFLKKTKKEIEQIKAGGNKAVLKAYMDRNEICSELQTFKFKTINATNDVPNGIDYNFYGARFEDITIYDGFVVLLYSWKDFDGNVLLSERFKSESAEKKFQNKEAREGFQLGMGMVNTKKDVVVRNRDTENLEAWLEDDDDNESEFVLPTH